MFYTDDFKKGAKKLEPRVQKRVRKVIEKSLADPRRFKPLRHASGDYRIRFDAYRSLYKVDGNKVIRYKTGGRDGAYDQ